MYYYLAKILVKLQIVFNKTLQSQPIAQKFNVPSSSHQSTLPENIESTNFRKKIRSMMIPALQNNIIGRKDQDDMTTENLYFCDIVSSIRD